MCIRDSVSLAQILSPVEHIWADGVTLRRGRRIRPTTRDHRRLHVGAHPCARIVELEELGL
eukprot:1811959-Alexandrium_andersonii.AAC.1